MGKMSRLHEFLNRKVGGVLILHEAGIKNGRKLVTCLCLACQRKFKAQFHNVYLGNYKSCGCLQHATASKSPRWKGQGKISKSYFYALSEGAAKRNLSFKVTIDFLWNLFLKQDGKCALTGEIICFPKTRLDTKYTASLDRIDAKNGYTESNVQWVHRDVNYAKQQMNNKEFLNLVKKIYEYSVK
jgi:hypothetical protein